MSGLHGRPFAAPAWKALIAACRRDVPFTVRPVALGEPENRARELAPTGPVPAPVDRDGEITRSGAVTLAHG